MQNGKEVVTTLKVLGRMNVSFVSPGTREILTQNAAKIVTITGAIPDNYIWAFVSIVMALGLILNFMAIYTLFCAKCNGARYLLLQISFCDIGSILLCGLDLWYLNYRRWMLPSELCPVYLGMESFISTATTYFIVAINLHAISTHNLAMKMIRRKDKVEQEYTKLSTEQTDEENCEETAINQKRSITIDYSRRKNKISVILPALFIWFLAASVSIPLFVFGNVIPSEEDPSVCGVINFDKHNNHMMQILLLLIRVLIPTICMHMTSILVILKITLGKSNTEQNKIDENVRSLLKLALVLSISYTVLYMQRIYGSLLIEIISRPFMQYKYPRMSRVVGLIFGMISFLLPCIRPCIYFLMDKNLKICRSPSKKRVASRKN